jgi:Flp pilus assembly protein TadG
MTTSTNEQPQAERQIVLSRSAGQAIVEFALTLPVLVLCVFGTLDLGRAVYAQFTLANAVREGARQAIIETVSDGAVVGAVVAKAASLGLQAGDVAISGSRNIAGSAVTVSASWIFRPVTPIISNIAGASLVLSAQTSMTVE